MALMYGFGSPDFLTLDTTISKLCAVEPMSFSLDGVAEKKESKKYRDGLIVTAGSALTSEKYTMKVGIEAVNWAAIQFAYGEFAGVTASAALPDARFATVPAGTPEVSDSDIVDSQIWVTVTQAGTWGRSKPLTRITTGAPAAGEFRPDPTNHKLIFNSAQVGAPITYRLVKTYANIESINAESAYTAFNSFKFSGVLFSDEERIKVVMDKITKTGIPSLNVSDTTRFDLEFDVIVAGSNRKAFQLYNLSTMPAVA